MGVSQEFVRYVVDQIDDALEMTHRLMFGGCTLYSKGKVVGLICEDQLFIKPTEAGRAFIGTVTEAPAYPGAKPSFLISDGVEDGEWLTRLIAVTADELPKPKRKKKSKR